MMSLPITVVQSLIGAGRHSVKAVVTTLLLALTLPFACAAADTMTASEFASISLGGSQYQNKTMVLDDQLQTTIETILGHRFNKLRLKYWQGEGQQVWVIDEVGYYQPITFGVHIKESSIVKLQVLAYRDEHGKAVQSAEFTDQFKDATLKADLQLDRTIHNTVGTSLSARAAVNVARMALWLSKQN